jgi:hypothetical protein
MAERDWAEIKPLVMQTWPSLAEEDVDATNGDREELLALIEAQAGIEPEDAAAELDTLLGDEA